ncbi:MAG TPA: TSCPD domain-containing protein [Firmicutes bacterium]|nr:TSCPD domain-containing protein [Bacillota bacterium]
MSLELSPNAITVLERRYLKKQDGKVCETPEDMFRRVARNIASVEAAVYGKDEDFVREMEERFYRLMTSLDFLPNSPTLMNAGRELQQLAACFVLPVEDSMEGIFDAVKYAALIQKSGGGVGFAFSRLRPKGDEVSSTGGVASGPVSFMKVFNAATNAVKQGGRRRGANMGILRVDHPDIFEFITSKHDDKELTNFNISVAATDAFMEAVKADGPFDLINPRTGAVVKTVRAREIFDAIVEGAWKNGDPGIIFIDRINRDNPTPKLGGIESTNPCITGDALVSTELGLLRMDEIVARFGSGGLRVVTDNRVLALTQAYIREGTSGGAVPDNGILSTDGTTLHPISRAFSSGMRPTVRLITRHGFGLELTPDHKVMTTSGWVRAGNLKPGYHRVLIKSDTSALPTDVVDKVIPGGIKPVYDLTEPATHSFIANGIVISNCGEQPLLPYEACNLGSINLAHMVRQGGEGKPEIDYPRLEDTVRLAVRFLDDVIDASRYPLDLIEKMAHGNRKIGLGVMGFADMLIKLGIPYDSEEAVEKAREVMGFIQRIAREASADLAQERGPFPNFEGSIYDVPGGPKLRNATTTTVAPTGTISIIAGCSSGVEPLFAVCYVRNVLDNDRLIEVNPLFEAIARERGFYSDELMKRIAEVGSVRGLPEVPEDVQRLFVTAHEISPEWHIRVQAAFQEFTDNAVSKTVNLRHDATQEDVRNILLLAYDLGCKGVTVYRDRSRSSQVLQVESAEKDSAGRDSAAGDFTPKDSPARKAPARGGATGSGTIRTGRPEMMPRPRPQVTYGRTEKVLTGCGNVYVTVNEDGEGLCEIFTSIGKSGGCAAAQSEAISRLVSMALRAGIKPQAIVKHLRGIRCPSPSWQKGQVVLSCPDAIGIVLEHYLAERGEGQGDAQGQQHIPVSYPVPGEREGDSPIKGGPSPAGHATGHALSDQEPKGGLAPKDNPARHGNPAPVDDPDISESGETWDTITGACPECGGHMRHENGCATCVFCGYSKCS